MEKLIDLKENLKRISSIINSIDNNVSLIEKDMLLQYIRDLYASAHGIEIINKTKETIDNEKTHEITEVEKSTTVSVENDPTLEFSINFVETNNEITEIEKPINIKKEKRIVVEQSVTASEKIEVETVEEEIKIEQINLFTDIKHESGSQQKIVAEQLRSNSTSINDLLAQNKQHQNISSIMSLKPISDIKSSIGVGDKFLFIRELFNGNSDSFETAVNHLNSLKSYDEADEYVSSNFNWDRTTETVANFMTIVKRRYL
jgi:hypothetical protein